MQATRLSEEDERGLQIMKADYEVDFEHGAMYIRDKEDITQYASFLPVFGAGGEICLLTDCDNIQAVPEDVSREFAIRYLLMKEAMDASAA